MTFTYRVLLRPRDISFKKKLLPSSFDNGIPLRETLQQLLNDEILLEDVPTIDVVWCKEKWAWYTLNQRRLWVFRELEKRGKCQYIATKRVETIEHVNGDFYLYGSAELIGETTSVSWDSDDGLKITVFDQSKAASKKTSKKATKQAERKLRSKKEKNAEPEKKPERNWRERTPLIVKVTWEKENTTGENDKLVTLTSSANGDATRERKDSGFSETSSTKVKVEKSSLYASDENTHSDDGAEESVQSKSSVQDESTDSSRYKQRSRRFNKFRRYRPYPSSPPKFSDSSASRVAKENEMLFSNRGGKKYSLLGAVSCERKKVHDRLLYVLHHGNRPRLEHLALKTKLMNTCGFCYKSFRAGVSLSQHIEELKHWTCVRCGKYFTSYTALGQHKLSLDHCNV